MLKPVSPLEGASYYAQTIATLIVDKLMFGTAVTSVLSFFGADIVIFWTMISVMTADYFFGIAAAVKRGKFRCRAAYWGILKFLYGCIALGLVGAVNVGLSRTMPHWVDWGTMPLVNIMMCILIYNDAISVLVHMRNLGMRVPTFVESILIRSRRKLERKLEEVIGPEEEEMDEHEHQNCDQTEGSAESRHPEDRRRNSCEDA